MKRTYRRIDGELVEVTSQLNRKRGMMIIPDIQEPFVSPVDGTVISSRKERRAHNRRNECEDVGNDPAFINPVFERQYDERQLREDVARSVEYVQQGGRVDPINDRWFERG